MPRQIINLIGLPKNQILGNKLPSLRDCLRVLFYNMRFVKLTLSESSNLVIDECLIFWKKARIPTRDRADCVKKLKNKYEVWRNLEKSKNRESKSHKINVKQFEEDLDKLFDIAHSNVFEQIKIEEDKEFLISQRKDGRPGCMLGIDMKLTNKEKRKTARIEMEVAKKQKYNSKRLEFAPGK